MTVLKIVNTKISTKYQKTNYGYRFDPLETKISKIPNSFFGMGISYVKLEASKIGKDCYEEFSGVKYMDSRLKRLSLSNKGIWNREKLRNNKENTNIIMYCIYFIICKLLDVLYQSRPIQRFWFLETVARMPYFSYVAVLHMYETLGWWKVSTNLRKQHSEEEWNETCHLRIMETIGGNRYFVDRFMASHSAIIYYVVLLVLFLVDPEKSYKFSELLENHAVDTYSQFIEENEELLKRLPVPVNIYNEYEMLITDNMISLYDVFVKIKEDEQSHANSMNALCNL